MSTWSNRSDGMVDGICMMMTSNSIALGVRMGPSGPFSLLYLLKYLFNVSIRGIISSPLLYRNL